MAQQRKVHGYGDGLRTPCGIRRLRSLLVDHAILSSTITCKRCRKSIFLDYKRRAERIGVQLNRVRSLRDKFRG